MLNIGRHNMQIKLFLYISRITLSGLFQFRINFWNH